MQQRGKSGALESQCRSSLLKDKFRIKGRVDVAEAGAWIDFIQVLDALVHIVLDGGEGGHYCGGAKAVGDHREVGQVPLDHGVEDGLGRGVAQGGPVLVQQIHQLLADHSGKDYCKKGFTWQLLEMVRSQSLMSE